MTWKQTASGRAFDLVAPRAEDVLVLDIAHDLAAICRYGGATKWHLSVAQHSILVASLVWQRTGSREAALHGLLHDAHEAYTGDVIGPLRQAIKATAGPAAAEAIDAIQRRVQAAIYSSLGLEHPDDPTARAVASADLHALFIERRQHLQPAPKPWHRDMTFEDARAGADVAWNGADLCRRDAERAFLLAFGVLFEGHAVAPASSDDMGGWLVSHALHGVGLGERLAKAGA